MAEDNGTTDEGGEGPPQEPVVPVQNEATLRSRIAGLDAKVSTLTEARSAEKARADAAEARAMALASGQENGDAELRAQLAAKDAELATARREAAAAKIAATYPETFAVFGEDVAGFSEEKLAASEARLTGVAPADAEPPTPRGNSGTRTPQGGQAAKPPTKAEIEEAVGREFKQLLGV